MTSRSPNAAKSRQHDAHAAYLRGDWDAAVALQSAEIDQLEADGKKTGQAKKLLSLYFYGQGNYGRSIEILKNLEKSEPKDSEIPENIGIMLRQAGNAKGAIPHLLKAHEMAPENWNVCDGLAHCYGSLGDNEKTQKFGRLALSLRNTCAEKSEHVWKIDEAPPVAPTEKSRQVIAFSLWGDELRYLRGALRNARLALDLYPDWTCRFYVDDSVPLATMAELRSLGCQLVTMPKPDSFFDGLLWRFQVMGAPEVDRFLIRDCDSVINVKERVAVDEWLASDRWFHVMRDFFSHTELILAGMWGGVNGALPAFAELREKFQPTQAPTRTFDQVFLREMVWPTMRQSVLIHDSVFTGELGSVDFPAVGRLPVGGHVGQNEDAVPVFVEKAEAMLAATRAGQQRFFVFGQTDFSVNLVQDLVGAHPAAACSALGGKMESVRDLLVENLPTDSSRSVDGVFRTWLEEFFRQGVEPGTTHLGLAEGTWDESATNRCAALFPDAKFLFVVCDPRTVFLSDARRPDDFAGHWQRELEMAAKLAQRFPGRVETVRFEDLVGTENRAESVARVFDFLGLSSGEISGAESIFPTYAWTDPWRETLSFSDRAGIEMAAGDAMKKQRYRLSETPVARRRDLSAGRNSEVALAS